MSTATSKTRTRTRNIAVESETPKSKAEAIAAKVYRLNREMNAAKTAHDKLRKELFATMKEHGFDHLDVMFTEGDSTIPLVADIGAKDGSAVDVDKLAKLVPMADFVKMASVTQKAVTEHAGTAILNQVLVAVKGTENVTVAVKK